MSLRRRALNRWLRLVEKPRIVRAKGPMPLRRALETQARLFFHAPRGTQKSWTMLGRVEALEVVPANLGATSKVILYVHGGGFTFGSPRTHAAMAAQLAHRLGVRVVLPRYRLAPEHPFPAAPDDVMAAWRGLLAMGTDPNDVIIGGDSAGGALAFGMLAQLCTAAEPKPAAAFGFSPLTDMTHSGDSFRENAARDVVLPAERAAEMGQMFLVGQAADSSRISPLFGDFQGAPPMWLTVGDTEILADDSRRFVQNCKDQAVDATLIERHDLPHVWPIFHNILPEARETLDQLAGWIRQLPGWQAES